MEHISKTQVKLVRSLQQKKFRDELGLFVAEGDKCISELRKSFDLFLLADHTNATETEIAQMSSLRTPQGSIAVFKKDRYADGVKKVLTPYSISEQRERSILLCLDGIQDPGNMGTIIRTCDWFGVRDVVCSPDTADCYNPKVVQATMGALARVRIHYVDLVKWLQEQTCPIIGTLLDGKNMYDILDRCADGTKTIHTPYSILHTPSIIVMGNEGNGISPEVRQFITHPVRIPSYPADAETSESLNVAIATAIILAEMRRPVSV